MRSYFISCLLFLGSCTDRDRQTTHVLVDSTREIKIESKENAEVAIRKEDYVIFPAIASYPLIKDSADFIKQLKAATKLEICGSPGGDRFSERISYYKKVQIAGSHKSYVLLEYGYGDGCGAGFPWKYQFLFTSDGKLMETFYGLRFQFLDIIKNQNPFLLIVSSTYKGNGAHELFKISADTLVDVLDGFSDYFPRTYDAHQDYNVNEPKELKLSVYDWNKDGRNDIVFSGKIIHNKLMNDTDDKENNIDIPVKYIFLYQVKSGHFVQKEDYSKKYLYLD